VNFAACYQPRNKTSTILRAAMVARLCAENGKWSDRLNIATYRTLRRCLYKTLAAVCHSDSMFAT
jgi:hypothetical protein